MRGMTLLARRLAIRLEDRVYKRAQRSDYRPAPFHLLALRWFRARQRLAHHSPMHPELVRHCPDRPNTELVFPTDLLEQLHLGSPLHPLPPLRQDAGLGGVGPIYGIERGRFTVSKSGWAVAEQGSGEEGIIQMRQGLAAYQATGTEMGRPSHLALFADACTKTGRIREGLAA